ncbi:UPF0715 family protein [Peribacillus aracenensis]|uniref:UPF0715 family protein n=1 Tax=Peribacillus aracenensis TaxID=2976708 RepID=UPI0037C9464C
MKKYFLTLLLSSITFAHIYMIATITEGSISGYLPLIFVVSGFVFLIYLVSAFPFSLLLNRRKKPFSIIGLIAYLLITFFVIQIIDRTFFERIISMESKMFIAEGWIMYVIWLGLGLSYWFWNSVFVLKRYN